MASAMTLATVQICLCVLGRMSSVVAGVSAAIGLADTGARLPLQGKVRAIRKSRLVRPERAVRARKGSAAKSIQRTSVHSAVPCRETTMTEHLANTRCPCVPYPQDRHGKNSCRRGSSFSSQPERPRAKLCSTALQLMVFLLAWSEMGTRFGPSRSLLPGLRTRNDLKSQTTSRSQLQRSRHAEWLSYLLQSRT